MANEFFWGKFDFRKSQKDVAVKKTRRWENSKICVLCISNARDLKIRRYLLKYFSTCQKICHYSHENCKIKNVVAKTRVVSKKLCPLPSAVKRIHFQTEAFPKVHIQQFCNIGKGFEKLLTLR